MGNGRQRSTDMMETTDYLEAVGVFKAWKNVLFAVLMVGLGLVQAAFWAVDQGLIRPEPGEVHLSSSRSDVTFVAGPTEVQHVAEKLVGDTNAPAVSAPRDAPSRNLLGIRFTYLVRTVRIANAVLVLAVILYVLTMLFSLQVTAVGRLGGIHHIARAFFLALIATVLMIPWQRFFDPVVVGLLFSPEQVLQWGLNWGENQFNKVYYYVRFTGYWALVLAILLAAQIRSRRWAMAILRRLEII